MHLPVSKSLSSVDALETLRNARSAALIIEVKSALILAANAPAARVFGFDPDEPAPALAAEMPALERLRDIVRGIEPCLAGARPLKFWTARGEEILDCTIKLIADEGSRATVLLTIPAIETAKSAVDQPRPAMDDAATLREIARRIREGSATLAAENGVPDMADPATKDDPPSKAPAEPGAPEPARPQSTEPNGTEPHPVAAAQHGPRSGADGKGSEQGHPAHVTDGLARLAHELRTPLSAIAAAAEIMRDERLGEIGNDRYKSYASDIFDGANHALSIIERLLPYAGTPEREAAASPAQAVDLNAIARSAISAMQPLAGKAGLSLSSDLQMGLPKLAADPTALKQIILNLLTNSVKFSNPGGKIAVRTWQESDGAIALGITDTGKGMSRQQITAALNSIKPRTPTPDHLGGMGIGLQLVRSLVEQHRGTLAIDSSPGRGTAITIRFPRQKMIAV